MVLPIRTAIRAPDLSVKLFDGIPVPNPEHATFDPGALYFNTQGPLGDPSLNGTITNLGVTVPDANDINSGLAPNVVGFFVYGITPTSYVNYTAGIDGANQQKYWPGGFYTNKKALVTLFNGQVSAGTVFHVGYMAQAFPNGFTGGDVVGAIPTITNTTLDLGNGSVPLFLYYNGSVRDPASSDANPSALLLIAGQWVPDPGGFNNAVMAIRHNNAGVSLRSCFVIDDSFPNQSFSVVSNCPVNGVNYTWVSRGGPGRINGDLTCYSWVDGPYGVPNPSLYTGWQPRFDDPVLNNAILQGAGGGSSNYVSSIIGSEQGILICFSTTTVSPGNFNAILVAPDWSSYRYLVLDVSDSDNAALMLGDLAGYFPNMALSDDGTYYMGNFNTTNPFIYAYSGAIESPGVPPPPFRIMNFATMIDRR